MILQPVGNGNTQDEPYIADFTQLQLYRNALGLIVPVRATRTGLWTAMWLDKFTFTDGGQPLLAANWYVTAEQAIEAVKPSIDVWIQQLNKDRVTEGLLPLS